MFYFTRRVQRIYKVLSLNTFVIKITKFNSSDLVGTLFGIFIYSETIVYF